MLASLLFLSKNAEALMFNKIVQCLNLFELKFVDSSFSVNPFVNDFILPYVFQFIVVISTNFKFMS